jgi:hypothetical protein
VFCRKLGENHHIRKKTVLKNVKIINDCTKKNAMVTEKSRKEKTTYFSSLVRSLRKTLHNNIKKISKFDFHQLNSILDYFTSMTS